ncbi:ferritin-like domain-containing protein [Pseudonocardia yunnanensis]|uniref:Ferritin-like domain-containing protein n=1 Tax=Pseudonocardia yunnanensis TaxID=58107 RepID=A0ABW4FCY1_9PSEU
MIDTVIMQLRALEQLTNTESQIARFRIAQARTDAVRRELRQNGDDAVRRARRIADQLRALDAVPDVVTPALGRVLAFIKSTMEQAQPIDEALLGDLTLEHQLLDRARYLRVLADRAQLPAVEKLADDLVAAHTATVEWLTTVLAEEALGGPAALTPTPLQRVAGSMVHVVGMPTRFAMDRVNRAVDIAYRTGEQARDVVGDMAEKVVQLGSGTREVAAAGRDAALQRAERVAAREGADAVAGVVHETRAELGGLKASELPIPHYEEMTAQAAIAALRELTSSADVNVMIAFEKGHKNRSGVIAAGQTRYAALAKDVTGAG